MEALKSEYFGMVSTPSGSLVHLTEHEEDLQEKLMDNYMLNV